jgi:putative polyketide hydroxylase
MTGPSVPVLIVGAGPAGLTTAIMLAHQGIGSLLVERREDPSDLPRATLASTRSMELFRSWGLESQVRAGSVDVASALWVTHTLATPEGSVELVGLPDRAQAAAISPTEPVWAPQDHVESVLLTHLRTYRIARIRYGTELVTLEQDRDGVRATVRDRSCGAMTTVSARFLVAADGAHSTVRGALGIPMHGPDRLLECVNALFVAPLWDVVGDRRYGVYWVEHAEAAGNFLPAGGDRWLYGRHWEPGQEQAADYPADRLIRLGAGVPELVPRLLRVGAFTFAAQLAERFRDRRVFLAGDAAHRITPRGGTGMNTAIHDGYDLGWKLAWTLHGWAGSQLLDTYEAERRPIAVANVNRSAQEHGNERDADEGLAIDLRGRLPHAWLPAAAGVVSTLDLLGPGLTLLTDRTGQDWHTAADAVPTPIPLTRHALDAATAAAVGIEPGAALLVRPDAHIAARWASPDTAAGLTHRDVVRGARHDQRPGLHRDPGRPDGEREPTGLHVGAQCLAEQLADLSRQPRRTDLLTG